MDPQRWRLTEELFAATVDLDATTRTRYLDAACGDDAELRREVEELLAAESAVGDPLADLVRSEAAQWVVGRDELGPGDRLGTWSLEERLGVGGMSIVYRASRDDEQFHKQVALKVLKRGMDTEDILRRFSTERQILAQLEHPNIARLLDAGSTEDGRPFFAMELVHGEPIDSYCDRRRLSIDQRLALFSVVCDAVFYAHRRLIVHRDLKPSNILVTDDGVPKLLDFGIAKLLDPQALPWAVEATAANQRVLTPGYASPEQILGQAVTTASDVYSLGVLLFQLLCGRRPYRLTAVTPRAVEQAIREQTPCGPSVALDQQTKGGQEGELSAEAIATCRCLTVPALKRRLRGDLDAVVLKALRKEPGQRYLAVAGLMDDLDRHLRFQPVLAHQGNLGYRVGRFWRRHRTAVTLASLVSLLLVVLITTLAILNVRLAGEREASEQRRRVAEEVKEFMIDLFPAAALGEEGPKLTASQLLERGASRALEDEQPAPVRAALLDTVGRAYQRLGLYGQAAPLLEEALTLQREAAGQRSTEFIDGLNRLAIVRVQQGLYEQAEPLFRETLELRRALYGPRHERVAASLNNLALLLHDRGKYQQAEPLYRQAAALDEDMLGPDHLATLSDKLNLGLLLSDLGLYSEAESLLLQVLAGRREQLGEEHEDVGEALAILGRVRMAQGDLEGAEEDLHRALELVGRQLGDQHPDVARVLNPLGESDRLRGDLVAATEHHRQALDIQRRRLGEEHPEVAFSLTELAKVELDGGRLEEATVLVQQAIDLHRRTLRADHPNVAASLTVLGQIRLQQSDPASAAPLLREAVEIMRRHLPDGHPRRQQTENLLGECLARQ